MSFEYTFTKTKDISKIQHIVADLENCGYQVEVVSDERQSVGIDIVIDNMTNCEIKQTNSPYFCCELLSAFSLPKWVSHAHNHDISNYSYGFNQIGWALNHSYKTDLLLLEIQNSTYLVDFMALRGKLSLSYVIDEIMPNYPLKIQFNKSKRNSQYFYSLCAMLPISFLNPFCLDNPIISNKMYISGDTEGINDHYHGFIVNKVDSLLMREKGDVTIK